MSRAAARGRSARWLLTQQYPRAMSTHVILRKPLPRLHLVGGRTAVWMMLWAYLLAAAWMPLAHVALARA